MERGARSLLAAHVALIAFSTIALTTFLAGAPPAWLATEPAQTIYKYGWMLSGPTYVVLGAAAILLHAANRFGWGRALGLLAAGALVSLSSELLGTSTGFPFGPYSYTTLLGYRIGGLVPFPIPLSWFYMIYASLAITGRILPAWNSETSRVAWAFCAGAILTAWDVAMDPAMSKATTHWLWHTDGFFYGMPLTNWIGWFLTGSVVARAMLAVVPPERFATQVSPSRLPLVIYAINGVMPIAICFRHELWWAGLLGLAAMGVPLLLARRSEHLTPPIIFGT
jgi:putative membrane protein